MSLARIFHPWNSTEETSKLTVIPPHIFIISEIEGTKREIEYLKGTIINYLQYEIYKRRFSSTEHNAKTIIDAMESQAKQIMEEIVRNNEVLTSKVKEGSQKNYSNIMDIAIEEEEEEE